MREQNKCIGIVSWLPDENVRGVDIRAARIKTLETTLRFFSDNFPTLPIIIVAQSWGDYNPPPINNKLIIYKYKNALKIIPARRELRKIFINSDFDYLIMSDDDIKISCNNVGEYLQTIDNHPNGVGMLPTTSLIMFAISKYVYSQIDLPTTDEKYFEDNYLIGMCKKYFNDKLFSFGQTFIDTTLGHSDSPSTWWENTYKIKDFMTVTNNLIEVGELVK